MEAFLRLELLRMLAPKWSQGLTSVEREFRFLSEPSALASPDSQRVEGCPKLLVEVVLLTPHRWRLSFPWILEVLLKFFE